MSRYNYASPVGSALTSIAEQLLLREQMKRQAQLDQLAEQDRQAQAQRQTEMLNFQRERAGVSDMQAAADQNLQEREFQQRAAQQQAQEAARAQAAQAQASQEANARGVRQMVADAATQGPLTPERARSISMMGYTEGVPVPGIVDQAMAPQKPPHWQSAGGGVLYNPETADYKRIPGVVDTTDNRNPIAVIGPDGKPIFVRPSDAIGRTPASNREQGRPVISGDANRIADFDTSLNDLDTLEAQTKGMTGTGSAIGAALPNAITDLTGWGADSKSRNAVIARVKQVIGKALEGGVLRKEDEVKYKDILPTISDEPSVAASKIAGLRQAIEQRRQTSLDAYADAGYDVSKYQQRQRTTPANDPAARAKALIDARRAQRGK